MPGHSRCSGVCFTSRRGCSPCADLRAERLAAAGHDARPSTDAGRFVCNYTYYLSLLHSQTLRQWQRRPVHALFLHVPPLEVAPLASQFACLLELLQGIAHQLAPGGGTGDADAAAGAAANGTAAGSEAAGAGVGGEAVEAALTAAIAGLELGNGREAAVA